VSEQEKQETAPERGASAEGAAQPEAEGAVVKEQRRPPRPGAGASPHGPETAVLAPPAQQPGAPIISRRRMLLVGFWTSIAAMVAGAATCSLDLIYPTKVTGFGGKVTVPAAQVPAQGNKVQIAEGRFWLVNLNAEQGGPGLLALWWKCPHLGCTVPWRPTFVWPDPTTGALKQGWFRCPCHGSTYTDAGIRVFGPAPRSMDTMAISVSESGDITVDTGSVVNGGPDNPDRAIRI
jgi:cytochrome b6-f complex iron-sulfur subunit